MLRQLIKGNIHINIIRYCTLKTESRDRPGRNFLHKGKDPVYEHIWHPPHADRTKEFRA
jgi:hypothetical protein